MRCCIQCFKDELVIELIKEKGFFGECSYCKCTDIYCLDVDDEQLRSYFDTLTMMYGENPTRYSKKLLSFVQEDWEVFDDSCYEGSAGQLLTDIISFKNRDGVEYCTLLPEFTKYRNMWWDFQKQIKFENRYTAQMDEKFKNALLSSFRKSKTTIKEGELLFRGRVGGEKELSFYGVTQYSSMVMGIPPIDKSTNGRANPVGIPYLYTANDVKTTISELRPWVDANITVATIQVILPLTLADFTKSPFRSIFDVTHDLEELLNRKNLLKIISSELSKPVSPESANIDYIPTQYVAELIKECGYEGFIFKSSLGPGNNVVLFNENNIKIIETNLYNVIKVDYDFCPVV